MATIRGLVSHSMHTLSRSKSDKFTEFRGDEPHVVAFQLQQAGVVKYLTVLDLGHFQMEVARTLQHAACAMPVTPA